MNKILLNILWLSLDKILPLGMIFIINVMVARYLGAEQFGKLNYLIAIVSLLIPIVSLGLNNVITREVINKVRPENVILGTCFAFRAITALIVSLLTYFAFKYVFDGEVPEQPWLLLLMALSLCIQSFGVVEFWVNSNQKNHQLVLFRTPALLIGALFKITAIYLEHDYQTFALLWGIDICMQAIFIYLIYLHANGKRWQVDWRYGLELVKGSWWLILSGVASVIYLKIDLVMLGTIMNDESVGIYAAASRFSEIWFFLPIAISTAAFPILLKNKQQNENIYRKNLQNLSSGLFYLSIAIASTVTIFAEQIVDSVYGQNYADAVPIVIIHIWSCIFVFIRAMISKWLITENLLPLSLVSHGLGALVNVLLNLFFIPTYGAEGAAWATIFAFFFSTILTFLLFSKTRYIVWIALRSPFPFIR